MSFSPSARRAGAKSVLFSVFPIRHSKYSVNICSIKELMDGWQADWVGMQSSSTEAFFKEISLLIRQGSPWPAALLAVDPAPPCITLYGHLGSDRQQRRGVTSPCPESGALVTVFQKKPLPMASVPPSTATRALCLLTLQHWLADGLQPRSSCMPREPSPDPTVCRSLSHLVQQPLLLAM